MPSFGRRSKERLATLHPDLQVILKDAIRFIDFTIVCGHRDEEAQEEAFAIGASTKRWPESKHNTTPSIAVDVAPWFPTRPHIDWKDDNAFARLFGHIERVAIEHGIEIRWGNDWDRDGGSRDQSFMDGGHIELVT